MIREIRSSLALILALSGCANSDLYSGDTYRGVHAREYHSVFYGVITNIRPVKIQAYDKPSEVGGLAGGVVGGVLGSTLGRGKGNDLAIAGGVVGGAIIGDKIADKTNQIAGMELEIKKDDGTVIVVVQKANPNFMAGKRVRISQSSSRDRELTVSLM